MTPLDLTLIAAVVLLTFALAIVTASFKRVLALERRKVSHNAEIADHWFAVAAKRQREIDRLTAKLAPFTKREKGPDGKFVARVRS